MFLEHWEVGLCLNVGPAENIALGVESEARGRVDSGSSTIMRHFHNTENFEAEQIYCVWEAIAVPSVS